LILLESDWVAGLFAGAEVCFSCEEVEESQVYVGLWEG